MKKIKIEFLLILLLSMATPAYGLFDAVDFLVSTCGKRGRSIDSIILNSLGSKNNIWVRTKAPYPDEIDTWSCYSQEGDDKNNPKKKFIFSELNYKSSEKYHSLDDFIVKANDELKEINSSVTTHYNLRKSFLSKVKVIFKEKNEICLEVLVYKVNQSVVEKKPTYDILGNRIEDLAISYGEEKIDEIPVNHNLFWIVDLGKRKFRQYAYWTSNRNLTYEEKNYLIERFKLMEEQIRKISS